LRRHEDFLTGGAGRYQISRTMVRRLRREAVGPGGGCGCRGAAWVRRYGETTGVPARTGPTGESRGTKEFWSWRERPWAEEKPTGRSKQGPQWSSAALRPSAGSE